MKRLFAILLALTLVVSSATIAVSADASEKVYVSIADENGKLVLAVKEVTATDIDADGVITINDALYAAHESFYEGGAEAGYASVTGDYGLSLTKLWGVENGGSYGYYVNNASAWSLADPVAAGDHVYAFVYTDLVSWSDTYSWFDTSSKSLEAGDEFTLTLSALGYDADWNPVVSPVEGATIYINGAAYITTDAEGKAAIKLTDAGTYLISAKSDTMTLVPPVCVATVAGAALPKTGTAPFGLFAFAGAMLIAAGCTVVANGRKRNNEI